MDVSANKENEKHIKPTGNYVLSFSPIKSNNSIKKQAAPIISTIETKNTTVTCSELQSNVCILNFGKVRMKSTNYITFQIYNPNQDNSVFVSVSNPKEKADCLVSIASTDSKMVEVGALSTVSATVYWTPTLGSLLRETMILNVNDLYTVPFIVHGTVEPEKVFCVF